MFLVVKYMYDDKLRAEAQTLGPWVEQKKPDCFRYGQVLVGDEGRKKLVDVLRGAQRAVLNPHLDPDISLHRENLPEEDRVPFSPNLVRLDISGPDLPDLSFYDLPGVIANVVSAFT